MSMKIIFAEVADVKNKSMKNEIRMQVIREGLRAMGFGTYAEDFSGEQLALSPSGKPFFSDLPQVRFSLSHSGRYIACAFSDREIGLDLQEHVTPRTGILRMAKRFFTPEEYGILLNLPEDSRRTLFFRLWTIKEAFLKYSGCGLQGGLDSFLPDPFPGVLPELPDPILPLSMLAAPRCEPAPFLSGSVLVLKEHELLKPAAYALLPAPEGYSMAVSAAEPDLPFSGV